MNLKVKHDLSPTNEVFINADTVCDFCERKLPGSMIVVKDFDQTCCQDCYDYYTDKWRD